ncbi:hypothetical protein EDB86DRAFT_2841121 [Lactarius hatsudake]|nr:hypothetical protein EDB86DRAFT_2841121 [Lactarius hatsudake]
MASLCVLIRLVEAGDDGMVAGGRGALKGREGERSGRCHEVVLNKFRYLQEEFETSLTPPGGLTIVRDFCGGQPKGRGNYVATPKGSPSYLLGRRNGGPGLQNGITLVPIGTCLCLRDRRSDKAIRTDLDQCLGADPVPEIGRLGILTPWGYLFKRSSNQPGREREARPGGDSVGGQRKGRGNYSATQKGAPPFLGEPNHREWVNALPLGRRNVDRVSNMKRGKKFPSRTLMSHTGIRQARSACPDPALDSGTLYLCYHAGRKITPKRYLHGDRCIGDEPPPRIDRRDRSVSGTQAPGPGSYSELWPYVISRALHSCI